MIFRSAKQSKLCKFKDTRAQLFLLLVIQESKNSSALQSDPQHQREGNCKQSSSWWARGGHVGPANRPEFVEEMRSAQHLFEYFEKQFGEGEWVFERCKLRDVN